MTYLLPCEYWLFSRLAKKKHIRIPKGRILELHLNTKVSYKLDCHEARERFERDLEQDLMLIKRRMLLNDFGLNPIITLNTFNRLWLRKTLEILGGTRYQKVVLTQAACNLYTAQKHKKVFKKMFPNCSLKDPGRQSPEKWDLIVFSKGV
ncbi:hypothetical protein [Desulforamulus ruminis]|uniref:Uncharacterized protein n=1 Tax=Desulforamulus ruminis (strain ATCC 23193 / DSM 2154 / NCIMB 8452 / DL) TaxID=696281 RepID=F6DQ29_DESRL|nr:hypothetical protein [Desulforamulus ruminis]AEG61973.1 hypothetical protein Desru_3773 [Desulforamulus ruminis DSM 2154]